MYCNYTTHQRWSIEAIVSKYYKLSINAINVIVFSQLKTLMVILVCTNFAKIKCDTLNVRIKIMSERVSSVLTTGTKIFLC